MSKLIKLSVHQLVDFLLRSGDIDTRVFNSSTMQEGTLVHNLYQSKQGPNYLSEYPLKQVFSTGDFAFEIEGRADGIIQKNKNTYIIDEIKSTTISLEEFKNNNLEWHLGQAKCYGLMFMMEKKLKTISVRLTYLKQGDIKERLIEEYTYTFEELDQFVHELLDEYLDFYNIINRLKAARNESIHSLEFPFTKYRSGQRDLAKYVYSLAIKGGRLYVEAPTGIGKTMSTLFPYIKALEKDEESRIFYLTAKSSGKDSAHHALTVLKEKGLKLGHIVVTSKEKICFCKDKSCNPDECPFAKGYYNKIQGVIKYCLSGYDSFTLDNITRIAYENEICPFEFELDLSLFLDVIICDYNYVFDPISYLKRYFDNDSRHYLTLVDEAHNLVSRSREMYSASISEASYLLAKQGNRHIPNRKAKSALNIIKNIFANYKEMLGDNQIVKVENVSTEVQKELSKFNDKVLDLSKNENKDVSKELTNLYLEVNRFLRIHELYSSDNYITYIARDSENMLYVKQFCLNPSKFIKGMTEVMKATVFFSATLSPSEYYVNTLGGDIEKDPVLHLPSPFPRKNLCLMLAPKLSIKYKNRDKSYGEVAAYIKEFVSHKIGNYLIYLPSYEYLDRLMPLLFLSEDYVVLSQTKDMSDAERETFLSNFVSEPKKTTVGFAIIGGSFSEGIDLVSDRLIGVAIVGIGMSKINFESDEIKESFSKENLDGYHYAYLFPGMNKVMQAVGRVIRTETDRGAVLLIDERYMTEQYRCLFRNEWHDYRVVLNQDDIKDNLIDFFK